MLAPFHYEYMIHAMIVATVVGSVCAWLSAYLMLKGWSLMGDALAHAVVPGVALAYLLNLPYAIGAFFSGLLAAGSMMLVKQKTPLREDATIGLIFTGFLSIGLVIASINPVAVNLTGIILGNMLGIGMTDLIQTLGITASCASLLLLKWREFMLLFFDADHAYSIGLPVKRLSVLFFMIVSAMAVSALQTVGACLVIALLVTPGATAYLITDKFSSLLVWAIGIGGVTSGLGTYASYFLDVTPGGLIVTLQTLLFISLWLVQRQRCSV